MISTQRFTLRLTTFVIGAMCAFILIATTPAFAVQVERVVSKGGIEAWLIRDHSNPITTMKFTFRGGAALDPVGKEGLADLAASTIDEGAGDMDSNTFQQTLDARSISISFDAGLDTFQGTLRTLNKNRDKAFDMLRLALIEPRFDADPVARIRAQIMSKIEQDQEDPGYQARRKAMETAFKGHPYARSSSGTLESVAQITRDDLKGFVARRFARDNLLIGVVGDIQADELKGLLDAAFSGLPAKAAPWEVAKIKPDLSAGVDITPIKVGQSAIQFAQPGISRDDPDFYTAYVLNYIVGGGTFVSRLYDEVREKRGLAYSIYSYLMPMDAGAAIMGGSGTANARAGETVATIRDVWAKFAAKGPTVSELTDAKTYLTGAFPLRFTSSSSIAATLVAMQEDGLGIDYIDKRNAFIEAVTFEDAKRVAKSLYQPDKLRFFIAGEPEGLPTE